MWVIESWCSAECGLHADIAARTDPVLDDELLAQMIRQILADDARNDVVGAARRKANNPVHRPCRIGLRPRDARDSRQRGSARCQMQKSSAWKFHSSIPSSAFTLHHRLGAHLPPPPTTNAPRS